MAISNEDSQTLTHRSLPQEILPGSTFTEEKSKNYIKTLVQHTIPESEQRNLDEELDFVLILSKLHSKPHKWNRKKKTLLTRAQRKEMNMLKLPKDGWNYDSLHTLRTMWKDYMRENLNLVSKPPHCTDPSWNGFSVILTKSELIGAETKVVKSKVPNQVGICGTIVLETKMTFQIVTHESKQKTIIKSNAVFEFYLDKMKFTVYGKYIATRPNERTTKKVKTNMIPEL